MESTEEQVEQAEKLFVKAGRELGEAKAKYKLALLRVQKVLGVPAEMTTPEPMEPKESKPKPKAEQKPSKPTESSKPTKPSKPSKPSAPAKPDKPSKPTAPKAQTEKPKAKETVEFDEYSSDMLARDAKDKIRDLTEEDNYKEKIFAFIKGDGEVEDRTTVLGVAETHIGEELVNKLREEEPAEEEPTEGEQEDSAEEEAEEPADQQEEVSSSEDQRVELPEGVDRPEGAPECFGNAEVYDPDSHKCMVCVFDFECEEAQEAIANE